MNALLEAEMPMRAALPLPRLDHRDFHDAKRDARAAMCAGQDFELYPAAQAKIFGVFSCEQTGHQRDARGVRTAGHVELERHGASPVS